MSYSDAMSLDDLQAREDAACAEIAEECRAPMDSVQRSREHLEGSEGNLSDAAQALIDKSHITYRHPFTCRSCAAEHMIETERMHLAQMDRTFHVAWRDQVVCPSCRAINDAPVDSSLIVQPQPSGYIWLFGARGWDRHLGSPETLEAIIRGDL